MHWKQRANLIGVHAEGEIGRVVIEGGPAVPGATMAEKLRWLNEVDDSFRLFCTSEPRGFCQGSVNLLLPPVTPGADIGFIVMQPDRCHAMSGSNAICVTTVMVETGRVKMREPVTTVTLDTAAGLVRARAEVEAGRCVSVTLDMPASFAEAIDETVSVEGLGEVRFDIAFGGVFYVLVDPAPLGLAIRPDSARELVDKGMAILAAARAAFEPVHPTMPDLKGLAYLMFCGEDGQGPRNATIMPPGRIDRSPCGTGSSARLAVMHEKGMAKAGDAMVFRSIIGSRFKAVIERVEPLAGRNAIRPTISGRGWIYAREEIGQAVDDPFAGHRLSDCWGPESGL